MCLLSQVLSSAAFESRSLACHKLTDSRTVAVWKEGATMWSTTVWSTKVWSTKVWSTLAAHTRNTDKQGDQPGQIRLGLSRRREKMAMTQAIKKIEKLDNAAIPTI